MENFLRAAVIVIIVIGVVFYFWDYVPNVFKSRPGEGTSFWGRLGFGGTSTYGGFELPSWSPTFKPGQVSYGTVGNVGTFSGGTYLTGPESIPDSQIPQGFTRAQLSPYFKRVRLGAVAGSFFGTSQQQLQIYSSLGANEKVDITGWHAKGNRGDVAIPQAANNYSSYGLNNESNIVISGSSVVNIYNGTSPISRNLRLNKCTGFLQNVYNFSPALPQDCPALYDRREVARLSGFCQTYILSLGACKLPATSFINALPGNAEGNACQAYLNTLTVNSCYDKHLGDADFLSNTWIVWVSQNAFDPYHDSVNLYDNKGLLVDQYTY